MTEDQFAEYLTLGHELSNVEFKGPGSRTDQPLQAKIIRAVLGMANRRNGGVVILGVNEANSVLDPIGLTSAQLASWRAYDMVADLVNAYADPPMHFDLEVHQKDGRSFVVLIVQEFDEVPVLCKKLYVHQATQNPVQKKILRDGACYVRPRRKHETVEVPTATDMRDLLALATEKQVRRFVAQTKAAGIDLAQQVPGDEELFTRERQGWMSPLSQRIVAAGYWDVVVRPRQYQANRVTSLHVLTDVLQRSVVAERGWDFPYFDEQKDVVRGVNWISQETSVHDREAWRFYLSGQFEDIFGFEDDRDDRQGASGPRAISIEAILYRFTEIFHFAAHLAVAGEYQPAPQMSISAQLHGLKDRRLYIGTPGKVPLRRSYQADIDVYPFSQTVDSGELVANPNELALAASIEVFDRFGWRPDLALLRGTQEHIRAR